MPRLPERILRALGAESPRPPIGHEVVLQVDDVDRRYRDAIKAGAVGIKPPGDDGVGGRTAQMATTDGIILILIQQAR